MNLDLGLFVDHLPRSLAFYTEVLGFRVRKHKEEGYVALANGRAHLVEYRLRFGVRKLEVAPGAPNVIPGQVTLTLDVRHAGKDTVLDAMTAIRDRADAVVSARGLQMEWVETSGSGSTQTPVQPRSLSSMSVFENVTPS